MSKSPHVRRPQWHSQSCCSGGLSVRNAALQYIDLLGSACDSDKYMREWREDKERVREGEGGREREMAREMNVTKNN